MAADQHEAFLTAIFKKPDDSLVRLVYADWLDERGHPGGELIRLRQQLTLPDLSKTKRATFAARERKVLAQCDRDWIVQLERADWKLRYLQVRPADEDPARWAKRRQGHWSALAQKAMTRRLAAFEKEVGLPLPVSWKAFALGCGAGELDGTWLAVPKNGRNDAVRLQRAWSNTMAAWFPEAYFDEGYAGTDPGVGPWIRNSVRFGGEGITQVELVWNTSRVTDRARMEYEVVLLSSRDMRTQRTYGTFDALWRTVVEQLRSEYGDEARPFEPD